MKYRVTADIEAESLNDAWEKVQYLPVNFHPDEVLHAVENGTRSFAIQAQSGRGTIAWEWDGEGL